MGAMVAAPPIPLTRKAGGFAALATVQVVTIASITMLTIALPGLQTHWNLSSTLLVVISTAYGVTFGALLLVAGRIADRVGHRRVLLGALPVFTAASLLAAAAPGPAVLIGARFLQGAGAAFAVPAAMALIPAVFDDPARRARATAVWGVLAVTGAITGTVASGFVVEFISWRWLFVATAAVAMLAAAVITRRVPRDEPVTSTEPQRMPVGTRRTSTEPQLGPVGDPRAESGSRVPVSVLAAVLLVLGLTALLSGLAAASIPAASAGAALLAGFAFTQRRTTIPLWPRLSAPMSVGLLAILVAAGANAATYYLLTLRLAATGYGPAAISLIFLVPAVAVLAAGPIAARLLDRRPPRLVLTAGLATAAAGLLLLGATASTPIAKWPALLIFPLGIGVALSAGMVAVMAAASDTDRGLLSGLANTAMEIGPPLVLALTAPLAELFGYPTGILVVAAAPALAALAALTVDRIRLSTKGTRA